MEPDLNLIRLQQLLKPFENTGIINTSAALPFRSMVDMQEAPNQDLVEQIIAENQAENYKRLMTQPGFTPQATVYDPYGIYIPAGYVNGRGVEGGFSYDMNKTSLEDYYPTTPQSLGFDTSYGVANEPDVEQVDYLTGQKKSFRDSANLKEYSENRSLSQGLESLLQYLPFGEKSLIGYLADKILPKESPEMKAAKSFYRDKYGLDPVGRVASGIMAGYNPVSGGLLNMITGGKYGKPPTIGLQRAYQKNIDLIRRNLDRGIYRDPQAKINKLNELIRDKRAEQMSIERPTIDRAKAAAPDVYSKAEANKALGPGGGFSTSGKEGAFSSKSGIGRQDY